MSMQKFPNPNNYAKKKEPEQVKQPQGVKLGVAFKIVGEGHICSEDFVEETSAW